MHVMRRYRIGIAVHAHAGQCTEEHLQRGTAANADATAARDDIGSESCAHDLVTESLFLIQQNVSAMQRRAVPPGCAQRCALQRHVGYVHTLLVLAPPFLPLARHQQLQGACEAQRGRMRRVLERGVIRREHRGPLAEVLQDLG